MTALKITHFSTSDLEGGSARSAKRIHDGLRMAGFDSRMLVGSNESDDLNISTVAGTKLLAGCDKWANIILQKVGLQYYFVPSTRRMLTHPWTQDADVFQLFNIHGGYFDPMALQVLHRRAPIVWRLSDLWSMTGHCAYPGSCERWKSGCGHCPDLATYPPIGWDTTRMLWRRKAKAYGECAMTVVAPSYWAEDSARQSPLFAQARIVRIPNGVDTKRFRPIERDAARKELGITDRRTGILFAAHVAFDNPRKGTDILFQALNKMGPRDDIVLLVAGRDSDKWVGRVPIDVLPLGYLRDDDQIAAANAAADIVVLPSTVENLPNTAIEALASKRPVVAFDVGGMSDAVQHEKTGLLCPIIDSEALAIALARVSDDPEMRARLGENGRNLVECEFSIEQEVSRFSSLYVELVSRSNTLRAPLRPICHNVDL